MTIAKQIGITKFPFEFEYKNDKGNLVKYFEDSYGYWCKSEYDSNGNEIYFEDSDGFWWTTEYDSRGNEISIEDCCGKWLKREFDSNGHEIYYEDSNGKILDNRPKASCEGKVVEIDGKKYKLTEVN